MRIVWYLITLTIFRWYNDALHTYIGNKECGYVLPYAKIFCLIKLGCFRNCETSPFAQARISRGVERLFWPISSCFIPNERSQIWSQFLRIGDSSSVSSPNYFSQDILWRGFLASHCCRYLVLTSLGSFSD